jgi:hypothetical protein
MEYGNNPWDVRRQQSTSDRSRGDNRDQLYWHHHRFTDTTRTYEYQQMQEAIIRGRDLDRKIRDRPAVPIGEIFRVSNIRYNHTIQQDPEDSASFLILTGPRNEYTYKNIINVNDGIFKGWGNYRIRRDRYDLENSYDSDFRIEGTNPLSYSDIKYLQIRKVVESQGMSMNEFNLREIRGEWITCPVTYQTMGLFVRPGEQKTFYPWEAGYDAAKGTPAGQSNWFLVAQRFPQKEITQVTVQMSARSQAISQWIFTIVPRNNNWPYH